MKSCMYFLVSLMVSLSFISGMTADISSAAVSVAGDVNFDGVVNINDIIKMRQYFLGEESFSSEQLKIADINYDGTVDIVDYVSLKTKLLGPPVLTSYSIDSDKKKIVDAINQKRVSKGYGELKYNLLLEAAADARARELAESFVFERPDGRDYDTIFSEYGYPIKSMSYQAVHRNADADTYAAVMASKTSIMEYYENIAVGEYKVNNVIYWVVFMTN